MARPLPFPSSSISSSFSIFTVFTVLAILSIFSVVMYLCASHRMRTKEGSFSEKKQQVNTVFSRFTWANNKHTVSISSKALLKMISSRKQQVQHGDEDDNDDGNEYYEGEEDAVWKKTIIMGEKCRPLDFSGKIEYDSEGNLLHNPSYTSLINGYLFYDLPSISTPPHHDD
ncbi:hypothetical protein Cgig2_022333 [Carnegiea gigantea]|uniref:Uncharacterized protein n=1 Tax=Carnegiea gigantea TaxID=171969 RepID=A0A9Q1KGD1_9CARY|nr:hypothetical protein Cgig2_022333 [Carnegiea gigantea]